MRSRTLELVRWITTAVLCVTVTGQCILARHLLNYNRELREALNKATEQLNVDARTLDDANRALRNHCAGQQPSPPIKETHPNDRSTL